MHDGTDHDLTIGETRFVAFDTETTGLWAASNRIVEIAGVAFSPGRAEIQTFQELVNPGRVMPEEVIAVHGITDSMVKHAEPAGPVLKRFFEFCGPEAVLIAHNAPFDISFVAWELKRNELSVPANPVLDTRDLARAIVPNLPSYSLLSLAIHFGLTDSQEHRALGDAVLVRQAFEKMLHLSPETDTLAQVIALGGVFSLADGIQTEAELPDSFAELSSAIRDASTIEITYAKPGQPAQERRIRPLCVHRRGNNLYLNAHCFGVGDERTFRLDRITSWRTVVVS